MAVTFRPAQASDSFRLAELKLVPAGDMLEFLFPSPQGRSGTIRMVAEFLAQGQGPYSYKSVTVADVAGHAIGMCAAFPVGQESDSSAEGVFIPPDRLEHIRHMHEGLVEDSLYVDVLSVHEAFRNLGIGGELLNRAVKRAAKENLNGVCLMAWADNDPALRFYARHGFKEAHRVTLAPHPALARCGDMLMLVRDNG